MITYVLLGLNLWSLYGINATSWFSCPKRIRFRNVLTWLIKSIMAPHQSMVWKEHNTIWLSSHSFIKFSQNLQKLSSSSWVPKQTLCFFHTWISSYSKYYEKWERVILSSSGGKKNHKVQAFRSEFTRLSFTQFSIKIWIGLSEWEQQQHTVTTVYWNPYN